MNLENKMKMAIDGTTYIVSTHFTDGEETVMEKIARLVQEDENIIENP